MRGVRALIRALQFWSEALHSNGQIPCEHPLPGCRQSKRTESHLEYCRERENVVTQSEDRPSVRQCAAERCEDGSWRRGLATAA